MSKNTIIALAIAAISLVGCYDGRDMTPSAKESLRHIETILDQYETRDGKSYKGMGAALLHEMQYRPGSFREGKFYPVGDHYSVSYTSSAHGLIFSVARDH